MVGDNTTLPGTSGAGGESKSSTGSSYDPRKDPKRKAKSCDPGWKYGYWPNLEDKNTVRCALCGKDSKAGIKRLKEHLVGGFRDIGKCTKTTEAIISEMRAALQKNKRRRIESFDDLDVSGSRDEEQEGVTPMRSDLGGGSTKFPSFGTAFKKSRLAIEKKFTQARGPMDAYVKRTPKEVVAERHAKGPYQTTLENPIRSEEERDKLYSSIAQWVHECGFAYDALKLQSFLELLEAIWPYGPGFKPPSSHGYEVTQLKSEKEKIDELKKKHRAFWKRYGCTLMSDGWTDKKGRYLINFLVNCPEGTFFLGFVDASSQIHDVDMLFELLDSKVEEIGEENVIQVVTDNTTNYAAAGRLLMEKRKKLFWTPSATHCIDLMMEEIGNLKSYKTIIVKASKITSFIYRHARLLDAMKVKTGGTDLVRPATTRFASSFLTLQSLFKHKDALRQLFLCEEWDSCNLSHTEAGKQIVQFILDVPFWNGVQDYLRASLPLFQAMRIVDGDERPTVPEVYIAMEEAKKSIKANFKGFEGKWKRIIKIIERCWTSQMEQPIYLAAFFLNPNKFYEAVETGLAFDSPTSLMDKARDGFNDVLVKLVSDKTLQDKITQQLTEYTGIRGNFATDMAIRQRNKLSPIDWWRIHGTSTPDLSNFAMRLLGLCCSSSTCEHNWCTEFIQTHTEKKNRLERQRLNDLHCIQSDLDYIQYNQRFQVRAQERRERNYGPLVLEDLDWSCEWMTGESDDELAHPHLENGISS